MAALVHMLNSIICLCVTYSSSRRGSTSIYAARLTALDAIEAPSNITHDIHIR